MRPHVFYTGVGSRECPVHVGQFMSKVAQFLYTEGYILRSGGAPGADSFFENGVTDPAGKEIFLPSKGFNGNLSPLYERPSEEAFAIAEKIHPAWKACKPYAKILHARNVYQVLGRDLNTPSKFLICWTARGEAKGGTRTAIKLAEQNEIPVLNLGAAKGSLMSAFEVFYMRVEYDVVV